MALSVPQCLKRIIPLLLTSLTLISCSSVPATPEASVAPMPSKGPVGRTMNQSKGKFAACGRDSISIQTGSTQKMQLEFLVMPDGSVRNAKIAKMSAPDPDLYSCVLQTLKSTTFPLPRDQKPKKVTYPLVIKSN